MATYAEREAAAKALLSQDSPQKGMVAPAETERLGRIVQETQGNLSSLREQEQAIHGRETELPTADTGIRTEVDVFRKQYPNIDPLSPAFAEGTGLRSLEGEELGPGAKWELAFAKGSNRNAKLDDWFGKDGWRIVGDDRIAIRMPDGSENLADSFNITLSDAYDLADEGLEAGAGLLAIAAAPATAGVIMLSALGTLAARTASTIGEVITAIDVDNDNLDTMKEIAGRQGTEAAIEFAFGAAAGNLASLRGAKIRDTPPVDPDKMDAFIRSQQGRKGVQKNIDRLKRNTGVKVAVSAGQRTGWSGLIRGEVIGEKMPLSADAWRKLHQQTELDLRKAKQESIGEMDFTAEDASGFLNKQATEARRKVDQAESELDFQVQKRLEQTGNMLESKKAGNLLPTDGGLVVRANAFRERKLFRIADDSMYGRFRELAGDLRLIPAKRFQDLSKRIRTATPKDAETGEPSQSFMTAESKRFLDGLRTVQDMTIDEARNARRIVDDMIDNTGPVSVNTQILMEVRGEISDAIEQAVVTLEKMDRPSSLNLPEAARALRAANEHHSREVDKFLAPGVRELFLPLGERGYKENSEVFMNLINGPPEKLSRAFQIMDPDGRRAFSRTAWNYMLAEAKPPLTPSGANIIDPVKLGSMIDKLERQDKNVLYELFDPGQLDVGTKTVDELREALAAAGVRANKLEFSGGLNLGGDLRKQVAKAVELEQEYAKEFKTNVIGPLIKNELGVAQVRPEDFARHITSLSKREIKSVQDRFVAAGKEDELGKVVLNDMYDRSFSQATSEQAIPGVIAPGQKVVNGELIMKNIDKIGRENLVELVGEKGVQVLEDIAAIKIGRKEAAAAQGGGLIVGSALAAVVMGAYEAVLPLIVNTRLFTSLATNQKVGDILTGSAKAMAGKKGDTPGLARDVAIGQIAEEVMTDAADDPTVSEELRKFFNQSFDTKIPGNYDKRLKAAQQMLRSDRDKRSRPSLQLEGAAP